MKLLAKLWCFVSGHRYTVIRDLWIGGQLVECVKCKGLFAMSHRHQAFLPWDDEFAKFDAETREMHMKWRSP